MIKISTVKKTSNSEVLRVQRGNSKPRWIVKVGQPDPFNPPKSVSYRTKKQALDSLS